MESDSYCFCKSDIHRPHTLLQLASFKLYLYFSSLFFHSLKFTTLTLLFLLNFFNYLTKINCHTTVTFASSTGCTVYTPFSLKVTPTTHAASSPLCTCFVLLFSFLLNTSIANNKLSSNSLQQPTALLSIYLPVLDQNEDFSCSIFGSCNMTNFDQQSESQLHQPEASFQMSLPRRSRSLGYRRLPPLPQNSDSIVAPETQRPPKKLSLLPLSSLFGKTSSPGSPDSSTASELPATPSSSELPTTPVSPMSPFTPSRSPSSLKSSASNLPASNSSTPPAPTSPPHILRPLDSEDPAIDMSWLRTFPVFGFSPRHPSDPRYQAIVKFNAVITQHGIGDLNLGDLLLALTVYASLVDRSARNVFHSSCPKTPTSQSSMSTISPTNGFTPRDLIRRRTAPVSYASDKRTRAQPHAHSQSSPYRAYQYQHSRALPSLSTPVARHGRALRRAFKRASSANTEPPDGPQKWTASSSSAAHTLHTSPRRANTDFASCDNVHVNSDARRHTSSISNPNAGLSTASLLEPLHSSSPTSSAGLGDDHSENSSDPGEADIDRLRRWSLPDDVLSTAHQSRHKSADDQHLPSIQVHLLHHMLRHAESIYGLPLTVASAPKVSLTRFKDRAIVCKLTGVLNEDLIQAGFRTRPFSPAYYVAFDHKVDAIVICIRGTANMVDTLTDVSATQDQFTARRFPTPSSSPVASLSNLPDLDTGGVGQDGAAYVKGYGHAGVLRSARNLYQTVRENVLAAVSKYPQYTIVTTGHSLGGAIAAVLALLFRDDVECPNAVSVAFGPPPCVTYDLAEQTAALGMTVVNGPDIVPRLSVALLLPLFATARYVADLSRARKALLALGVRGLRVLDWAMLESVTQRRTIDMEKLHDGRRLFLPGRVVHLVPRDEHVDNVSDDKPDSKPNRKRSFISRKKPIDVLRVSRTKFLYVKERQKNMFMSHAPIKYANALASALHARNETVLSVKEDAQLHKKADLVGGFTAIWAGLCNGALGKNDNHADQSAAISGVS